MAEAVSGLTGGIAPLGVLSGTIQGGVNNLINTGSTTFDNYFPPEKREEWKAKIMKFATEQPKMAGFLLSHLALSGGPLFLFGLMTLTIFVFAIVVGLLVGVLGAALFTLAAAGFALVILLPVLFFTTFAACFIFLWGLAAYYIVKWFNQEPVPGIHIPVKGGLRAAAGLDKPFSNPFSETPNPDAEPDIAKYHLPPPEKPKSQANGHANGHAKKGGEKEQKTDNKIEHKTPPKTKASPKKLQSKETGADDSTGGDAKKRISGGAKVVVNGAGEAQKKTDGVVTGVTDGALGATKKAPVAGGVVNGVTQNGVGGVAAKKVPVAGGTVNEVTDGVGGVTKKVPIVGTVTGRVGL